MWPFKSKDKVSQHRYVTAKKAGTVTLVQSGMVVIDGQEYSELRKTYVQPGQTVTAGQVVGAL